MRRICVLFAQIWSKMSFRGKGSFRYSNYLQSCQKTEKTNEAFLRKILELMDGWMGRRTETDQQLPRKCF